MSFFQDRNTSLPRITTKFLQIEVNAFQKENLLSFLKNTISTDKRCVILGHNLHSAYLIRVDSEFASAYELADVILADGFPIVMDSKLTSRSQKIEKIGSTDWLPELIETCGKIRLLVVGATIESNANFRLWIKGRNKEIEVRGIAADPMPDDLHNKIRSQLNDFQPNLLLIGMGMPLQETILTELNGDFHCVVACVGGAIDQLGGKQSNCPRWLAGLGFEWLWRLISNPRRLAGRYLLEPFLLLRLLLVKKLDS